VSKKNNPWVLSLSLAALVLAPALHSAENTGDKTPAKTGGGKVESSVVDTSKDKAADKPAADTMKSTDKAEEKTAAKDSPAKSSGGHKSKALAGGLAVFPGIAVHGAGHMYAGSWMKGLGLLVIEGAAVGIAANTIVTGTDDIQKLANGMSNGQFPTDVSAAFSKSGILIVSTMAFLWTWFDDMAGAPVAANEYNKLVDEQSEAHLRLQPRLDGVELALSTEF
jgi:TM2 domain-containing membrane protein YozV